jgi:recombinational DNA repair protein RecR
VTTDKSSGPARRTEATRDFEGAIREAVSALRPAAAAVDATRATLTTQVRSLDAELSRLAAAVAAGGDFAALLEGSRYSR